MDRTKYIGMDVHKDTISIAVMNSSGKLVMESILETKAATIVQFVEGLRGSLHVTFEEGTWAAWLYELLQPRVTKVTVCNPRKNALLKSRQQERPDRCAKAGRTAAQWSTLSGLPRRKRPPNAERTLAQLSDDQQRSHASDEPAQGALPRLGHCLRWYESLHPATSSSPFIGLADKGGFRPGTTSHQSNPGDPSQVLLVQGPPSPAQSPSESL